MVALFSVATAASAQYRDAVPELPEKPKVSIQTECTSGVIPSFDIDIAAYQSYTLTWEPPSLDYAPTYQIIMQSSSDYCDLVLNAQQIQPQIVGETTATTFTGLTNVDNRALRVWVVVKECTSVQTEYAWVFDTFRSRPPTPPLVLDSLSGRTVRLRYEAGDARSYSLRILRDSPLGGTGYLDLTPSTWCPAGSSKIFEDSLANEPDGLWRYRLAAQNAAGDAVSSAVTISVGDTGGTPEINSFSAIPATIRPGQSSTLVWSAENATSVQISPGSGSLPPQGTLEVSPTATTTYTLTAFGSAGTSEETTVVELISTPQIVVTKKPEPIVQGTGSGGGTTRFVCANAGGSVAQVMLSPAGSPFFTMSMTQEMVGPGETWEIEIVADQRATGVYDGEIVVTGDGVPPGTRVPVRLLAVPTPDGPTAAEAEIKRVDVNGQIGQNPTGTAIFRNTGQARIQGTVVSTEPWLIPPDGIIEIDPGKTATIIFTIDRAKRPADAALGSLEGKLKLVFRQGPGAKTGPIGPQDGTATTTSLVTVVDTSTPQVGQGAIPALAAGEVALFLPGAGHVEGSTGLFFSDMSFINLSGSKPLNDLKLFFKPLGSTSSNALSSTVTGLVPGTPIGLADIVKSVFNQEQIGSLQIRTKNPNQLAVSASTLSKTRNGQKTFGATIPMLRSDRSVGAAESFFITGLKRTATSHTNLFIQETSGGVTTIDIEFLNPAGQVLGSRTETAGPFELVGLFHSDSSPVLPLGAVSARMTSRADSTGRFAAYGTPVDRASGDFWSLLDWNAQYDFPGSQEMLIPVAGALRGANQLNFRTDLAIINRGETNASGTLRYITRLEEGRPVLERKINLGPGESSILEDVTASLFGIDPADANLGFMKFIPENGEMTVTSRNFATVGSDPGSFGTGVPTVPLGRAMKLGEVRRIGGVKDSAVDAIAGRVPGTFRSNLGLMETSGEASVTVRVTLHFSFSTGTTAVARGSASKDFTLQPNQFMQLGRISQQILGESRDNYGDFSNLQADFAVTAGSGSVMVFVSSVENDTGDSDLRVE